MSTALVLGGGGPIGVAWEAGVIAGLAQAGVDLSTADRIVGTSAGSLVGARLALTGDAAGIVEATARVSRGNDEPPPPFDIASLIAVGEVMQAASTGADHATIARDAGRLALDATTIDEDAFVELTGASLGEAWPTTDFVCTAWDAETGAFRVWDRQAGVPLDRAVSSSCSVPGLFPPITVGGGRHLDGGIISASNAFLAEGHERVVVISVLTGALGGLVAHMSESLRLEVDALRAGGSVVEVVEMGQAAVDACGGNLMDFAAAADVADVGRADGREAADRVGAVWG